MAPSADHADNHRAEHQVNQQFQNKIDADHSKDHISNDRLPSTGGPCLQIGREQEKQTQQEQAGIDHRADDASGNRAAQHTTAAVGFAAPGNGPIDQAGSQTGQDTLAQADQGGQEGIGVPKDISAHVPAQNTGQQYDGAEHPAQARARLWAVQGRADQDRRQGQRDGEGAELDKTGDYLQDNNNGRHQGQSSQASGLFACSHMKLPPAAAPYLEGCSAIYLPTADSR